MSNDEDELIEQLKQTTHGGLRKGQQARALVSLKDLVHAETIIGFPLPTLLRRIYLEVGNGGFGPGYGLFPLNNEEDPQALETDSLVTDYVIMHSASNEQMEAYRQGDVHSPPLLPEKMMIICDWGCNISSWLDCAQPELPVLSSEATLDWHKFVMEAPSFFAWVQTWLDSLQPDAG
jgi:hypothetical protein